MENYITPKGNSFVQWLCKCDCGSSPRGVLSNALLSGKSTSCGCSHSEICANFCKEHFSTHHKSKTRLYRIWAGMKKRCQNKKSSNYRHYGGRGICVCSEWNNFESFESWALSNGYQDNLSIDRIDVNGDYTPTNCRWVTRGVQANNRRSNKFYEISGESHTLSEWANLYNLNYKHIHKLLTSGKTTLDEIIKST